jgi:hypothetical protein
VTGLGSLVFEGDVRPDGLGFGNKTNGYTTWLDL